MPTNFFKNLQDSYFYSQPHQPFFLLAFINAIVTMLIFMLSYNGMTTMEMSPTYFHAYGLTYLLFTPAFFAFLFTTFPRFSSTPAIEKKIYIRVFYFYLIGSILFILGTFTTSLLSNLGMLVLFIGHILGYLILKNIYDITNIEDKHDLFWIQLAMLFGLGADLIFLLGHFLIPSLIGLSIEISTYLYLFLVAFAVAQRMVPFFSHCMIEKNMVLLRQLLILLVLHLILETIKTNSTFLVDLFIAYVIAKELLRWKLPFPNSNPLLMILHIALFWIPVAFILSGLTNFIALISSNYFLALDIHTILLGFVFTILIGFGTRVTLGHSGNQMFADKYTNFLFIWTQVVIVLRIFTSLVASFGWNFMILFNITATAWLLMFIAWGLRFFVVIILGKKLNY